ncbi:hypothetical protein Fmac_004797 [Flemingia macrophylla]|uniref:Uncharacterized protein n=1 Tax=Flemingia macrophylla TaxID=520843 RepID=A0ABD1N5W9_9FABA
MIGKSDYYCMVALFALQKHSTKKKKNYIPSSTMKQRKIGDEKTWIIDIQ